MVTFKVHNLYIFTKVIDNILFPADINRKHKMWNK